MIKRIPLNEICKKFTALLSDVEHIVQTVVVEICSANSPLKHLIFIFIFIFNLLN